MFTLTEEQQKLAKEFAAEQNEIIRKQRKENGDNSPFLFGAIGGIGLTYCFEPTSIGVFAFVKHASGAELDLNDYSTF